MATWYHAHVDVISRSQGRTAVGIVAYVTGKTMQDKETGLWCKRNHPGEVIQWGTVVPEQAPAWLANKDNLNEAWDAVAASEKRKNSELCRHWNIALYRESTPEQQVDIMAKMAKDLSQRYGCMVTWAVHEPPEHGDDRNPHGHLVMNTRRFENGEFAEKIRELSNFKTKRGELVWQREMFAGHINDQLERMGIDERVSHKSYKDQGIDREPTRHMGDKANQAELNGEHTAVGDENRAIKARNEQRDAIMDELKRLEQETIRSLAELKIMQSLEDAQDAIRRKETVEREQARKDAKERRERAAHEEAERKAEAAKPASVKQAEEWERATGLIAGVNQDQQAVLAAFADDKISREVAGNRLANLGVKQNDSSSMLELIEPANPQDVAARDKWILGNYQEPETPNARKENVALDGQEMDSLRRAEEIKKAREDQEFHYQRQMLGYKYDRFVDPDLSNDKAAKAAEHLSEASMGGHKIVQKGDEFTLIFTPEEWSQGHPDPQYHREELHVTKSLDAMYDHVIKTYGPKEPERPKEQVRQAPKPVIEVKTDKNAEREARELAVQEKAQERMRAAAAEVKAAPNNEARERQDRIAAQDLAARLEAGRENRERRVQEAAQARMAAQAIEAQKTRKEPAREEVRKEPPVQRREEVLESGRAQHEQAVRAQPTPTPTRQAVYENSERLQAQIAARMNVMPAQEINAAHGMAWDRRTPEVKPTPSIAPVIAKQAVHQAEKGLYVTGAVAGKATKLADFFMDFIAGPAPKPHKFSMDPTEVRLQQEQRVAAKRSMELDQNALSRIQYDIDRGANISASDLHHLTDQHKLAIKQFGDNGLQTILEDERRRRERDGMER